METENGIKNQSQEVKNQEQQEQKRIEYLRLLVVGYPQKENVYIINEKAERITNVASISEDLAEKIEDACKRKITPKQRKQRNETYTQLIPACINLNIDITECTHIAFFSEIKRQKHGFFAHEIDWKGIMSL